MLTLLESVSLAGDRAKQNDDACGAADACAWVIDGATDLHEAPDMSAASDAAWLAAKLNGHLHASLAAARGGETMRQSIATASAAALKSWQERHTMEAPRWKLPTASVLIAAEHDGGVQGLDLGDCRCFVRDADGAGHVLGGHDREEEAQAASDALKRTGGASPLRDAHTLDMLRGKRAKHNQDGSYWVFGLQPECAAHARAWSVTPSRPAHMLLCTDGFAVLADRYRAYEAAGLVAAAVDKGLQELARELRAIESADAGAARHPRFKKSDDATALLLRLD